MVFPDFRECQRNQPFSYHAHLFFLVLVVVLLIGPIPVLGHGGSIPWLERDSVDENGLYCEFHCPMKIRNVGPLTLKVSVLNLEGSSDYRLRRIELVDAAGATLNSEAPDAVLVSQKPLYLEMTSHDGHAEGEATSGLFASAMQIAASTYRWPHRLSEEEVQGLFRKSPLAELTVRLSVEVEGQDKLVERRRALRLLPPLPTGTVSRISPETASAGQAGLNKESVFAAPVSEAYWFAGDQHVHTTYSVDTHFPTSGVSPATVTEFGDAARALGLSWIVITDHSNIHGTYGTFPAVEYYTQEQYNQGTAEAAAYTAAYDDFTLLYAEEMGVDTADPTNDTPAHMIVFPFASPSTGFIENPSSGGLLDLNYLNCESAQVIFDRVNLAGGLSFIAHPFISGGFLGSPIYDEWDDWDATGYAGLEIWSDDQGVFKTNDEQSLAQWYTLLSALGQPRQLPSTPSFPNSFPVGLGNSDAHMTSRVGNTFTYCWMETDAVPQHPQFAAAINEGHCVAGNGPLMFITLNQARVGEHAGTVAGTQAVTVSLRTTAEFDDPNGNSGIGNFALELWVNGSHRQDVSFGADPNYVIDLPVLMVFQPGDTFLTAHLRSLDAASQWRAYSNPIWFSVPDVTADYDRDGDVDSDDFDQFQICGSGPAVPLSAGCENKDFDQDSDVDHSDFAVFQRCISGENIAGDPSCTE